MACRYKSTVETAVGCIQFGAWRADRGVQSKEYSPSRVHGVQMKECSLVHGLQTEEYSWVRGVQIEEYRKSGRESRIDIDFSVDDMILQACGVSV